MTELIVLYRMPNDPERFDKYYREVHGPMTSKLPGLKGYKYGPARALDGGTGEFFWYWSGTFDSTSGCPRCHGVAGRPGGRCRRAKLLS